jgi:glyoxylate reductase
MPDAHAKLPRVIADGPLAKAVSSRLEHRVELLPWTSTERADPSVDAIYTYGHPTVHAEIMDRFQNLQVISNYGVGVDHIDLAAATERGIPVGNTPGILDGATADMALALLLASARRLTEGDRYARSAEFDHYDPGHMLGREVHGSVIGIVGLGRIGWQVAIRARGFGMTILYHNRKPRADAETELGALYTDLDTLLTRSDYVVLCPPLNDQTRGMIGRPELARMQDTATLVNIGRGPLVDTAALTDALQNGEIYSAGLDVTDPEPLPRDHPLLRLKNVTISPHLGSATEQTRELMANISVENLFAGMRGSALTHQVNRQPEPE